MNQIHRILLLSTFFTVLLVPTFLPAKTSREAPEKPRAPGYALPPAPKPPSVNPHPPVTQEDKRRVEFAQKVVELLLKPPLPQALSKKLVHLYRFQSKDLACLEKQSCYKNDPSFVNELIDLHQRLGEVVEIRHPHIIPWSMRQFLSNQSPAIAQEDMQRKINPKLQQDTTVPTFSMPLPELGPEEYLVHLYVRFSDTSLGWYHLDVIMSEDQDGHLFLRHFFATPMPVDPATMDPRKVCYLSSSFVSTLG